MYALPAHVLKVDNQFVTKKHWAHRSTEAAGIHAHLPSGFPARAQIRAALLAFLP
jgi:hypothetical protein